MTTSRRGAAQPRRCPTEVVESKRSRSTSARPGARPMSAATPAATSAKASSTKGGHSTAGIRTRARRASPMARRTAEIPSPFQAEVKTTGMPPRRRDNSSVLIFRPCSTATSAWFKTRTTGRFNSESCEARKRFRSRLVASMTTTTASGRRSSARCPERASMTTCSSGDAAESE